jgi:hypothetical protein
MALSMAGWIHLRFHALKPALKVDKIQSFDLSTMARNTGLLVMLSRPVTPYSARFLFPFCASKFPKLLLNNINQRTDNKQQRNSPYAC